MKPFRCFTRAVWLLLLCLATCSCPSASGADVALNHQAWSVEEGLPQSSVHQVFQSRDGYLWLATEGGVARFDGYGFRTYNHQAEAAFLSDDISAIAETNDSLWFGTANGLLRYQHSVWRRYDERDGLASSAVLSLAVSGNGSLLVLTSRGVDRFDGSRFTAVPVIGAVRALQAMGDGTTLLLGEESVFSYRQGHISRDPLDAMVATRPDHKAPVLGLQTGPQGTVWIRSAQSLLITARGTQRSFQAGRELPRGRITALYVDGQGTGWIGTNHGLFVLKNGPASRPEAVDALRLESVLCITEDREGNLWIGTETSGLHALRPRKFQALQAAAGEAVTAGAVLPTGAVWFGVQDDGIRQVQHGNATQPILAVSLTSPIVLAMAHGPTGDNLWVGTPDGLNGIMGGKRVRQFNVASGLPDDYVRSVLVDRRGTAWAGTRRGLASVEGSDIRTYTRSDGLGSDSVGPLLEDVSAAGETRTANLWVGTAAGLSHMVGGVIQNFRADAGPSSTTVTALAQQADGTLWVALNGRGLAMFTGQHLSPLRNKALPVQVSGLAIDTTDHLWLRAEHGVYRASIASLRACAVTTAACNVAPDEFGIADGLPSEATTSQGIATIWRGHDGRLYFPTRKGIGVVDPAQLPFNRVPPPVMVQQLVVDDVEVPLEQSKIKVSSSHHRYTFTYAALSYTLPAKNRFRYQLEGFDAHWIDGGTLRTASYTSLAPGSYTFRVEAQNNDGVWSTTGAAVRFRILPPLYRTWWFSALMLVVAMALAGAIFWLHTRTVQQRFAAVLAERTRIARDVHDTLAQDLVSVSLQLSLAKRSLQTNDLEGAGTQLDATRKLVTTGLDAVRQSIWNLRSDAAEESLPTRMTQLARSYAQHQHRPQLKIGGAFRRLAPGVEAEVLQITRESLSNAYRHAGATHIAVTLHYDTDALRLTVRDDGRGFSVVETRTMQGHYGLVGMRERAVALHAQLTVSSSIGEGTTVTLYLPLSEKERFSA